MDLKMYQKLSHVIYISLILLSACNDKNITNDEEIIYRRDRKSLGLGKFFGEEALLFSPDKKSSSGDVGIGVNAHLWRASLDTISFMPLKLVDPFGGVVITDWYTPQQSPNERLKVDILILDRQLRADGIKVSVFRQEYKSGHWVNANVDPETIRALEDAILTRARQLKIGAGK
jgi:uncharacterized protein DUF3576